MIKPENSWGPPKFPPKKPKYFPVRCVDVGLNQPGRKGFPKFSMTVEIRSDTPCTSLKFMQVMIHFKSGARAVSLTPLVIKRIGKPHIVKAGTHPIRRAEVDELGHVCSIDKWYTQINSLPSFKFKQSKNNYVILWIVTDSQITYLSTVNVINSVRISLQMRFFIANKQ